MLYLLLPLEMYRNGEGWMGGVENVGSPLCVTLLLLFVVVWWCVVVVVSLLSLSSLLLLFGFISMIRRRGVTFVPSSCVDGKHASRRRSQCFVVIVFAPSPSLY